MRAALLIVALVLPNIALALRTMRLYCGFWLARGTVIGTILNIALTGLGLWIHQMKAITAAENGGLNMAD